MPGKQLYVGSSETHQPRLIKFTQSDSRDVHQAWTAATPPLAPALLSCLALPGGWWEVQMELLSVTYGWLRLDEAPQHRLAAVQAIKHAHQLLVDGQHCGVHGNV